MPLRPGLLGLATLVAVSTHAPEETRANREQAYWTIVEQYLHGDRSRAVSAIASWSGKDLGAVEDSIAGIAKTAQKCARCEARTRLEALPLPAAVLLLAERDRADRVIAVSRNGGQPDCSIGSHETLIEHLLRFVRLQSGSAGFAERFLTARSLGNWADLCLEDARRVAADGLDESPRDAMLHFAHGLAHEAMGTLGSAGPSRPKAPDPRPQRGDFSLRPVDYSSAAERKNRLELAQRSFEKALSESPNFGEARLRQGRI